MNEAGWIAVVVAFLTGAGSFFTALNTKRKIDADSESISVSTMRGVLEDVRSELQRCHDDRQDVMARLEASEEKNRTLEARIDSLEAYLKLNHGVDPDSINGQPI